MIAVDTNVVSELMKVHPDSQVLRWGSLVDDGDITVPTVAAAELFHGVERLPGGSRRFGLELALDAFFRRVGDERMLHFDARAAVEFGRVMGARSRAGRPIATMDALIAATCLAHDVGLATRNIRDFGGLGLELVDPWR
ncbi:type II toxin-antitoxin system VapC family toxin [Janibacter cremeus]|uniref:Ribonuclease VapC n=1 Tax=Janibacter cremeus TaxID=1285192 RepID=A0A852VKQ9_9MICO|nr:type II toxin-antitoxin system VapC family toxin [Janibacter cremeus]NYF96646.1 hypothetical protein [Janibacter cremeus]